MQEFKVGCKAHGRELQAWPERERGTALRFFLHLADIANPCKPRELSQEWSRRITEEFFLQVCVASLLACRLARCLIR